MDFGAAKASLKRKASFCEQKEVFQRCPAFHRDGYSFADVLAPE
jgi:hypothetical protein